MTDPDLIAAVDLAIVSDVLQNRLENRLLFVARIRERLAGGA